MSWWRKPSSRFLALLVFGALVARAEAGNLVERVRYVGTASYSRVVIDLSAPTRYTVLAVPGDGEATPRNRLVVDVAGARIGPEAKEPLTIGDALLQRIRTGQYTADTARVVLDFSRVADYRVFTLPDPFRLVIDMRGQGPALDGAVAVRRLDSARAAPGRLGAATVRPARPPQTARGATGSADGRTSAANRPAVAAVPPAAASPLAAKRFKVMIDPGHGGKDPGARGVGGVVEKDAVLAIARELAARLREDPAIEVALTRADDRFLSLEERTALANALEADLFLSIHANASRNRSARGIEVYYLNNTNNRGTLRLAAMENGLRWDPGDSSLQETIPDLSYILSDLRQTYKVEESRLLADQVGGAMVRRLEGSYEGVGEHGVREGPFYVLVGAYMPCVWVEVSYLTNRIEGARLARRVYRRALADGIYRGIHDYILQTRMAKNL